MWDTEGSPVPELAGTHGRLSELLRLGRSEIYFKPVFSQQGQTPDIAPQSLRGPERQAQRSAAHGAGTSHPAPWPPRRPQLWPAQGTS